MSSKAEKRQRQKQQRRARVEEEIRTYKARRRRGLAIRLGLLLGLMVAVFGLVANAQRGRDLSKPKPCSHDQPKRTDAAPLNAAPPMTIDAAKTYTAIMETSCGRMEIELATETSPNTVNSFVFLAKQKFYDGLSFHRVTPFAVQGGDPEGNGSGGPGYQVTDAPPADFVYAQGVVAMAKTGADPPGTSGSQFFLVTDSQQAGHLNGSEGSPAQYAVLGKITKGLDTLQKLGATETFTPQTSKEKSTPIRAIYIVKITIRESKG